MAVQQFSLDSLYSEFQTHVREVRQGLTSFAVPLWTLFKAMERLTLNIAELEKEIRKQRHMWLPDVLMNCIFSFLSVTEKTQIHRTSHLWAHLLSSQRKIIHTKLTKSTQYSNRLFTLKHIAQSLHNLYVNLAQDPGQILVLDGNNASFKSSFSVEGVRDLDAHRDGNLYILSTGVCVYNEKGHLLRSWATEHSYRIVVSSSFVAVITFGSSTIVYNLKGEEKTRLRGWCGRIVEYNNEVYVIDITPSIKVFSRKFELLRKWNLESHHWGVSMSFRNGALYIWGGDTLSVYSTTGELLWKKCFWKMDGWTTLNDSSSFWMSKGGKLQRYVFS